MTSPTPAGASPTYRLIFGLSADPVHAGHVDMVAGSGRGLIERGYNLGEILLVPVYRRNPVGADKASLPESYHHRFAMCGLAAREIARRLDMAPGRVRASDIEAHLARGHTRPNYTAETLTALRLRSAPGTGLIFLISSELVAGPNPQFARWYRPEVILKVAALAICPRPGYAANAPYLRALMARGANIVLLPEVTTPAVAATELRARLRMGQSPAALVYHGLLLPSVARYIGEHSLYET
ncbi:MAG: nicotinate-nicotinamide nucleotide adenylyltransferase [Anaerolineae bacterium]|nr:nicotinate-nicotinamide nucleotide adenylyltransferase [Anaerolineae bacterium]